MFYGINARLGLSLLGLALISLSGCVNGGELASTAAVMTAGKPATAGHPKGELRPAANPQYDGKALIPAEFTGTAPEAARPPSRLSQVQVAYAGDVQDLTLADDKARSFEPARVIEYRDPLIDNDRLQSLQVGSSLPRRTLTLGPTPNSNPFGRRYPARSRVRSDRRSWLPSR